MPFGFGHHQPRDPRLPPLAWWQQPWARRLANLVPVVGPALSVGLGVGSNIHDRHSLDHLGQPTYGTPGFGGTPTLGYGGWGNMPGGYGSTGGNSYGTGLGFGNGLGAVNSGGLNQFGLPTGPVNLTGNPNSQPPNTNGLGQLGQPPVNPHFGELDQRAAEDAWGSGGFNSAYHNPADSLMRSRIVQ